METPSQSSTTPAYHELLTKLSPAELKAYRWISPAAIALELSRGSWQLAPHLDYISRTIRDRIVKGNARLILTVPPRHGKSELCSVWLPVWLLALRPWSRVGVVTYGHQFSAKWGRKIRNVIREHGQTMGATLDPEKDAASEFELLQGGSVLCTGINGVLIGHGFDLLLFDDPYKSRRMVESDVEREIVQTFWTDTARNRLEPNASVVVIMQRWREDDLVGFLQSDESGEEWETINLPAIAEEGDPIGRQPGAALWPERYDAATLDSIRKAIRSYSWASQYQQRPAPAEGSIFRRAHFRYFSEDGERYSLRRPEEKPRSIGKGACRVFQTIDTGLKAKTHNDPTAVLTFAITPSRDLLVLDYASARLEVPDQMPFIQQQRAKWDPVWQGVEDAASGIGLIQEAQRKGLPFKILKPDKDKVSRAHAAVVLYENGMIYHRAGAEWLSDFESELLTFPTGRHDEAVDVVAYAAAEVGTPAPEIILL